MKFPRKSFIETKYLFYSTLAIITVVIISVWLSGKEDHRSLFQNSILSTSILAGAFFLFITLGLYFFSNIVMCLKTLENVKEIWLKALDSAFYTHFSIFYGAMESSSLSII
ncbi:hypothetical protein EG344_21575 [Chryseobacterium sp. G0162]|uniref:hypothetical protein n=1 Tax=Chryseobacterium sp. G0162 TaxID=2487063 RepID=UPI000F4EB9A3|nr:hypothetical protein [Chryseobacterium sp. G0162]AZB11239.1 hypothetical protein EG344_21575 [Chryseobacterium sp. G0162]